MRSTTRRLFLASAPLAAVAASCAISAPSLAQEFEAAWAEELKTMATDGLPDPVYEAAYEKTSAIVDRIMRTPTRDLEGFKLKARAFEWCYSGDRVAALKLIEDEIHATDMAIVHSVMRDLLAL
jgi:hypothetical protein